jgi:DNA polymerase
MLKSTLIARYIRQQKQMGLTDIVLSKEALDALPLKRISNKVNPVSNSAAIKAPVRTMAVSATPSIKKDVLIPVPVKKPVTGTTKSKLSSLRPVESIIPPKLASSATTNIEKNPTGVNNGNKSKRDALKALYSLGCKACGLASSRNKWVFGAGSADAPVLVIGDAPGPDEDEQGLPFVGASGELLTSMLAAIKLDRNKDVFITYVLKCQLPGSRGAEAAENQACMALMQKQVTIIQPKAILLLGQTAAQVFLGTNETIAKLRSKVHDYFGIPLMVIYHPGALLRSPQYKRTAWEDLKKFQAMLENLGIYGISV